MAEFGIKIEGFKEVEKALNQFSGKTAKRILSSALRAGAKSVKENVERGAPQRSAVGILKPVSSGTGIRRRAPGFLSRNIIIKRAPRRRSKNLIRFTVAPNSDAFYGHIQGRRGRGLPTAPWLKKAWRLARRPALRQIERGFERSLKREARKIARNR